METVDTATAHDWKKLEELAKEMKHHDKPDRDVETEHCRTQLFVSMPSMGS